jgi:putative addiction module component (TIGR02574 family)
LAIILLVPWFQAASDLRDPINSKEIVDSALRLGPTERLAVIEELLRSLDRPDPELDRVWIEEAERRLAAYRARRAKGIAAEENTTINEFINVAVAEKAAALRTESYFRERAARADLAEFDRVLAKAGTGPPRPADEVENGS